MIYFIIAVSSVLSGMGIGGGSLVIIFLSNFNVLDHKQAMIVSIIIFIVSGICATFFNLKNQNSKVIKKYFYKLIGFVVLGSFLGSRLAIYIPSANLKKYFNFFMLIIGIYEIISSLISLKKDKI